MEIFSLLANVADVKSLVIHPATTTHSQLNAQELQEQGIRQNTIRLSIGTEHIDDIIADLEKGFASVEKLLLTPSYFPKLISTSLSSLIIGISRPASSISAVFFALLSGEQ